MILARWTANKLFALRFKPRREFSLFDFPATIVFSGFSSFAWRQSSAALPFEGVRAGDLRVVEPRSCPPAMLFTGADQVEVHGIFFSHRSRAARPPSSAWLTSVSSECMPQHQDSRFPEISPGFFRVASMPLKFRHRAVHHD